MDPMDAFFFLLFTFMMLLSFRGVFPHISAGPRKLELTALGGFFISPPAVTVTIPPKIRPKEGHSIFHLSEGEMRVTYEFWRENSDTKSMEVLTVDVPKMLGVNMTFGNEEIERLQWHQCSPLVNPTLFPLPGNEALAFLRRVRVLVIDFLVAPKTPSAS